jgi:hypothetical protein
LTSIGVRRPLIRVSNAQPRTTRKAVAMDRGQPTSINDIRTAIRELSVRAQLARKEGRKQDAVELERRVQAYRDELGKRP